MWLDGLGMVRLTHLRLENLNDLANSWYLMDSNLQEWNVRSVSHEEVLKGSLGPSIYITGYSRLVPDLSYR